MAKTCKFQKENEYVSYNCGETWLPTGNSRKIEGRDPVEYYSQDCGFYPTYSYRWTIIDGEYECDGIKKLAIEKLQYSIDGESWFDVPSSDTRTSSTVLDYLSEDCGYVESTGGFKFSNGTDTVDCGNNNSSVLTRSELSGLIKVSGNVVGDCAEEIAEKAFSGSNMTEIEISDYVRKIGNYAFYRCSGLTSLEIPTPIIGGAAFQTCSALTSVTLESGVTSIGGNAFNNCKNLKSVSIADSVTDIHGWAFSDCSNLKSITIPSGVTKIEGSAFMNCDSLSSITISNGVKGIGFNCFQGDDSIKSISLPASIENISWGAFEGCTMYGSNFAFPSGLTSIENEVFYSTKIESVTIPNGVNFIGYGAFHNHAIGSDAEVDDRLSDITIPGSVKFIGTDAFSGRRSLTGLTIPNGVEVICRGAFSLGIYDIPKQQTIVYPDSLKIMLDYIPMTNYSGSTHIGSGVTFCPSSMGTAATGDITFTSLIPPVTVNGGAPSFDHISNIYVPAESLTMYKTLWSSYANIIKPIE